MSAAVDGAQGPTPDPDPDNLKVSEQPEAAVKLENMEAPSEGVASASRMQLDQNLSDNIGLSGKKLADCFTYNQQVVDDLMPLIYVHWDRYLTFPHSLIKKPFRVMG